MTAHPRKKPRRSADALRIMEAWARDDAEMKQLIAEERGHAAVARQIYALRTAHGLTQKKLAERIGTKQPVIARLEDADYAGHSLTMLFRIGAALGYDVSVAFVARPSTGIEGRSRMSDRAIGGRRKGVKRTARRAGGRTV